MQADNRSLDNENLETNIASNETETETEAQAHLAPAENQHTGQTIEDEASGDEADTALQTDTHPAKLTAQSGDENGSDENLQSDATDEARPQDTDAQTWDESGDAVEYEAVNPANPGSAHDTAEWGESERHGADDDATEEGEEEETFYLPIESAHDTAERLLSAGLSVISIRSGDKAPRREWKEFQRRRPTFQEVRDWVDNEAYAIVCGPISGRSNADGTQLHLLVVDFDVKAHYDRFIALVGDKVAHLPLVRTGGGGYHLYCLTSKPLRSEKLAWVPDEAEKTGRTIGIETRGGGGFVVGPNSLHETGNYYTLLRGDLAHIPFVADEVLEELFAVARSLDEAPFTRQQLEQQAKREGKARDKSYKEEKAQQWPKTQKVIEGYNSAHPLHDQFLKYGYTPVAGSSRYARPGGNNPTVVILPDGQRCFHHGSNSGLSTGHSYSAFDLFCHYEHGGDFKEALKDAAAQLNIDLGQSEEEKRAARRIAIAAQAGANGQVAIEVGNRQLVAVLNEMVQAMGTFNQNNLQLFRGGPGLLELGAAKDGVREMVPVLRPRLQVLASKAAFWFKNGSRGVAEVSPDAELMDNYLASPAEWAGIPDLDRLAHAPFFDTSGEMVHQSGYHAPTRTLLCLPDGFDLGDIQPTPQNVAASIALWKWLLEEVAFADKPSFAHAIALAILPFVRKLIHGPTPLHLANAPSVSSGKTTAMAICMAAFAPPVITTEKGNEEEWRKALVAKLLTATSHVFLDNIKRNLNSSMLDAAITAPNGWMEDRLLGASTNVRFPTWCVWVATANNAHITEDVASRTVLIDLDTNEENPEGREFKGDPLAYIAANRGKVCGALITLVRAWQEAGCPNYSGPHRTRFPQWQRVMGGILETVGIEGFLGNLSGGGARLGGDDTQAWEELVGLWWQTHGESPQSASDLYPLVAKVPVLAGSLTGGSDATKERSWWQKLGRVVNRRFGGYKIVSGKIVNRRGTYQLVPPTQPDADPNSEPPSPTSPSSPAPPSTDTDTPPSSGGGVAAGKDASVASSPQVQLGGNRGEAGLITELLVGKAGGNGYARTVPVHPTPPTTEAENQVTGATVVGSAVVDAAAVPVPPTAGNETVSCHAEWENLPPVATMDAASARAQLSELEAYLDEWKAGGDLLLGGPSVGPWNLRDDLPPNKVEDNWPHAVAMPRFCDLSRRGQYPHFYEYFDSLQARVGELRERLSGDENAGESGGD